MYNHLKTVRVRKNNNGFAVATVHWRQDTDKNNHKWEAEARKGLTERAWNREYEIDYTVFAGKPFYPEFSEYNIKESSYYPRQTIYRGWDFGFHRPYCLITVLNQFDQWCWLEGVMGEDVGIMDFGKRIREHCITRYPGAYYVDAGDPAGEQVSDKSEKTSIQILQSLGIYVRCRKQPKKQGAEIIRQKLPLRVDGKPGIIVNPDQTFIIDAMKGGLHYPEVDDDRPEKEFYQKDGIYDHFGDTARYLATEMFTVIGENQQPNDLTRTDYDDRYENRMGKPESETRDTNQIADIATTVYGDTTQLEDFF